MASFYSLNKHIAVIPTVQKAGEVTTKGGFATPEAKKHLRPLVVAFPTSHWEDFSCNAGDVVYVRSEAQLSPPQEIGGVLVSFVPLSEVRLHESPTPIRPME
ncbi:hypothetical protein UFOVP75_101 [uncultured Caudovirales phage]|uniref:GroES chaperonin family n=1 Tax=uncultured Caudovirales phage TaxID=2100421 RepID=A0A6J5L1X6_9CAUD|nr:hypothetical protein UFOVP75_101 [uncultured Caudovirales phage]